MDIGNLYEGYFPTRFVDIKYIHTKCISMITEFYDAWETIYV